MIKDGVYFDLPEDEYHAIKALSSSGIRDLLESPTKFWFNSNFNFLKEEKRSSAMLAGKVFHSAILENGMDKYVYDPDDLNKNSKAYKDWSELQSKTIISKKDFFEISTIIKYYEATGALNIFKEGYPEVSIIWTEADGIRRKARIDYLTLWGFIDLKTFVKQKSGNLDEYVSGYFYKYKIHIQLVWYRRALKQIANLPFHGTKEQKQFLGQLIAESAFLPCVLFLDRETPHPVFKVFSQEYCPDLFRLAEDKIYYAESLYKECLDTYGEKKAWLHDVEQSLFKDSDFPESFKDILDKGGE